MTLEEFAAQWEAYRDEFIEFERVVAPKFKRPDLCAFARLEELAPGKGDLVSWAEHDEIGLSTDAEELATNATTDDIIFLLRCGIRYDEDDKCFKMFV